MADGVAKESTCAAVAAAVAVAASAPGGAARGAASRGAVAVATSSVAASCSPSVAVAAAIAPSGAASVPLVVSAYDLLSKLDGSCQQLLGSDLASARIGTARRHLPCVWRVLEDGLRSTKLLR